jgi:hypothetical protein
VARAEKSTTAPADRANALAAPGALESEEKVENFAEPGTDLYEEALDLYAGVQRAYDNKQEQTDKIEEYWNIYQAKPDSNQQYSGNSQCYVPAVRDCVNARTRRALKQLFPARHKHVEAVGSDPEIPFAQLALLEHDIRATRLKEIVRSDLVAGDVTGQWNLYIDWTRSYRRITELVKRNPALETIDGEEVPLVDPNEEEDATEESDLLEEGPDIVDFATEDLAVVPPTCNDIERADAVSLRLRLSKDKTKQLIDQGVFIKPEGMTDDQLWEDLEKGGQPDGKMDRRVPAKARTQEAGIKTEGTYKYLLAYEVTARLSFDDEENPAKSEAPRLHLFRERAAHPRHRESAAVGREAPDSLGAVRARVRIVFRRVEDRAGEVPAVEPERLLEHGAGLGDVFAAADMGRRPVRIRIGRRWSWALPPCGRSRRTTSSRSPRRSYTKNRCRSATRSSARFGNRWT